ncbi:MAG: DUF2207 domain-containing protein [Desulfoferrobacter sp.]
MLPKPSKYIYPAVLLTLMSIAIPICAAAQDFTIDKYHADITIREDSSFDVTETIDVEFSRPKHGIYREIPYKYVDELGKTLRTPIEVLSVSNEAGRPWNYKVSRRGSVVNIRIGDANRYVEGRQTYIISYNFQNAILFLGDHDELYWNVTGNYWKAPITEASARVQLAAKKESDKLLTACYTGRQGSRETACTAQTEANAADFYAARNLEPGEGLTVSFGWQKGLVSPPSAWKKFLWTINLSVNWVFLFPIASFIFMFNAWSKRGRDPKVREAITVTYGPPKYMDKTLSPAELGTLVDEKLDSRDITAAIVGLAEKGYLTIEEKVEDGWIFDSTDYTLKKLKEPDESLGQFETTLLEKIFAGYSNEVQVSDLKNKFYTNLSLLKDDLYRDLVGKGYFANSPEKVRKIYFSAGVVTVIALTLGFALLSPDSARGIIAGIATGLPILALARFMPAKTAAGAFAHNQILGFEEFLTRAEKDRLERIDDKHLFSKFLPYAIALDVIDSWAKAFEGIYQEPPQWYVSSRPGRFTTFSPRSFSSSLNSMTSHLASAMFSAPRGSRGGGGFGSGGSSAGGFGGGGGGSW